MALLGLLAFALFLTGCSVDTAPTTAVLNADSVSSPVRLLITRDFGAQVLLDTTAPHADGMTAMSLLASATEVETGYGGGFVGAIDGLASTFGRSGASAPHDWFYWVDGSLGEVGAGDHALVAGQTVWWDYHPWSGAAMIQSTLAAFPRPFSVAPVQVLGPDTAAALREWLAEAGVETALPHDHDGPDAGDVPGAGHAAAAYTLDTGLPTWVMEALKAGARAGIFAQVNGERLQVLTEQGDVEGPAEAIALAVRNPSAPDALVLLVLASDQASLEAFLQQISPGDLSGHVGVYLSDDAVQTLPAGAGS
ncbi:MAG: DUF4430 domain-containing protein [Gaiellales bacterium]|nr:DUF4430 domain-containing protein [Gaiellales bacterium]